MFKSNKKIFIMIAVYTVILLGVVGMFLFVQNTKNENAVTSIYITTKTIQAGETVDDTLLASKVKKIDYPVSAVKEIEANGGVIVTSPTQIASLVAVGTIPAGQPLTKALFEAVTPSVYGDYTNKTYAQGTANEWKFTSPDYIILSVEKNSMPINGFTKGDEISIEGYAKYSYDITKEGTEKDEDGNIKSTTETISGEYSGILTNHVVVHNIVYDDAGNVTYVGVIIEKDKYPLISTIAKSGELIYHSGYTEAWETTSNDQYEQLLLGKGLYLKDVQHLPTKLDYTDTNENVQELTLTEYSETSNANETLYPSFIRTKETSDITITSPYGYAQIVHYNLDGTVGQYMDATGLNTSKIYNSKTGLYTYTFNQDVEGYYEIVFGAKNSDDSISLTQKICFVIEQDDYEEENKSDTLTMNLNFVTTDNVSKNYNGYTQGNIFESIDSYALSYEYSDGTVTIKDGTNICLEAQVVEIGKADYKKVITYEYNGNNYIVVLSLTSDDVSTKDNVTKGVYKLSNFTVLDSEGEDTVNKSVKIAISQRIINDYTNYAMELTVNTSADAGSASIKETYKYIKASYYSLSQGEGITFSGNYSKSYFTALKAKGINLYNSVTNYDNLNTSNLFNSTQAYGSYGNASINGVNLVLNDNIKLQLFYNFSKTGYVCDNGTINKLASALGVNSEALRGILQGDNLSKDSVNTIYNSIFNETILSNIDNNKDVEDFVKLIGFVFTNSSIDLTNTFAKTSTDNVKTKMFNTEDLVSFIESLKVEFVLSNGETITSNIKVNY